MEEYIRLEEEKARRHGRTFNWQTATLGKVKNYEDEDDCFIDFKTEFPAIVFDNTSTTLPSEPTVCPPNENKIDFRISLDESDDENYTIWHHYPLLIRDTLGSDTSEVRWVYWGRASSVRRVTLEELFGSDMNDVADTLCFQLGGDGSNRLIPNKGDLKDYWIEISSDKDFLGPAPSYVLIRDPVRILCHWMIPYSISGRGRHLRRHAEEGETASIRRGHIIGRLLMHFLGLRQRALLRGAYGADESWFDTDRALQRAHQHYTAPPLPLPTSQPRTMSQRTREIEGGV
ncbi:hypothetical protein Tco_0998324 [Tanacetum coccineum]